MGNYNPSLPVILGQEWVPIRDEDLLFDESVNAFEQGTGFTLATARQVSTGRFYTNHPPKGIYYNQAYTITVYTKEMEDSAGPVRSVVIPVNNGATTGSGVTILSPDTTVAQALSNPGTAPDRGIRIQSGFGVQNDVNIWFAVNGYSQILAGKRILGVNYLYQFRRVINPSYDIAAGVADEIEFFMQRPIGGFTATWGFPPIAEGEATPPDDTRLFVRRRVGDVAMWYGNDPFNNSNMIPWTYEELQKLEASASNRVDTHIRALGFAGDGPDVIINYMGLEVFYCEENRTLFGTTIFNNSMVGSASPRIGFGLNNVALHPVTNTALSNTVLPAGDYIITLAQGSLGDNADALANFGPQAEVNALRELYPMEDQPGYRVEVPFPLDEAAINRQIQVTDTVVLPQLSLHTSGSGAALTEPHPYGRQVSAEVWGTKYVQQELFDTPVGAATSFPWVRFYARRWGDTTIPLTLTGQGGLAGSTVSITPDEFDALSETLDGWKEISLQFSTPPSMGTLGTPTWRWTATGELAGNRWEILGASAPAVSGIPGNLYNLAPSAQQLYEATYYQPTGATQDLEWMPQGLGSPYVSGAGISDDSSDAFLIFGQLPQAVTGFGVVTLCQPITGIGQECDVDPCCIPSSLAFNQLTWSQVSTPASGFGYYEVQRSDTVETDWLTIMQGTAITGTTFNDFEARVGIDTSYRIRSVDLYGFWGDWSATVTANIGAPGITIGCSGGHVLIFTSNQRQSGEINLAYSSVWYEQRVQEEFTFPESSFVQLQAMYDRDYFTAFRPMERGGEQFTRTVLVQAAAIDPETLGDFRSLRDMAWADVNYICVRDEDGNRWFATVGVPSGRVLNSRRLYLAPVQVVEVTDIPTPVDPADEAVAGVVTSEVCDENFSCDDVVAEDSFTRIETDTWGVTN